MPLNSLQAIFDDDVLGLLDSKESVPPITPNERLIASFQEIIEYYTEHKKEPEPINSDISQYKLFSRLQAIRQDLRKIELLKPFDKYNLLTQKIIPKTMEDILKDEDLSIADDQDEILSIKNVPKKINVADYIGRQKPCKNFHFYETKFTQCYDDLKNDKRLMRRFTNEQQIEVGQYFILKGVMVYVAEKGVIEKDKNGKMNARLRLIYENATESDILLRSFARELYRDGRRVTEHNDKLMAAFENIDTADSLDGYIYVLSSLSQKSEIESIKNLYKIGFSTTPVEIRIANAASDPTYLMAPVHIMQTYKCYNLNPQKFEHLLHRFFSKVRLDLLMTDNLLENYVPDEWFVVPFPIIDQAVQLIINGEIIHYRYDYRSETIIEIDQSN